MTLDCDNRTTCIARLNFRNDQRAFGIRRADRRAHLYVIGKTGTGKSTLLETLMLQDIASGEGMALLDPHGDLVERILSAIPSHRRKDLVYFNAPDLSHPMGFNPLERVPPEQQPLAASGLLEVFKKIWAESWGPRMEHILRNALLTLVAQPEATLRDVLRLLDDRVYRQAAVERVASPNVRAFWLREYEGYPRNFRAEAIAPIQNKVGAFLASPILSRILTQTKSAFDLRKIMDEGRLLLVNLAKGKIGEDATALLGAMLVSRIGLAALGRAEITESSRRDFYLYLDEFHSFTTLSLANMLSELRKYRVNLVLAQQYFSQVDPQVRDAVLGNVGTLVSFRVGPADAEVLEKEFAPEVRALDLVSLPNYRIYLKLMIAGKVSRPFSAETIIPREPNDMHG